MGKRVLVLSTSVGSGHKSAASALELRFRATPGVDEVKNLDALELTNDTYRSLYSDIYLQTVKDTPHLVGWIYDRNDAPFRSSQLFQQLFDWLNNQPLVRFIKEFAPDITVCTHYMPAGIVSQLMSTGELDTALSVVTTDYEFQGQWLSKAFNRYFVALEETKVHLCALGMPEDRITVSGIPVSAAFGEPFDREEVQRRYALDEGVPTLLISAGAVGSGPTREIVSQVMQLRREVQAVVVCGRNIELRREVEALVIPQAQRFRVLGFSDDMPNLMRVSSLLIGKPGGLTASESMASGLPMLIVNPIPGQEERNSDHLLEEGAAMRANQLTTLAYKLERILGEPGRLDLLQQNARRMGRPDAAQVIVDTLLHDTPVPMVITPAAQKQIAELAAGAALPPPPSHDMPHGVALYDEHTGVLVGLITEEQLRFLRSHLEQESATDDDYYINLATVELLQASGADAELVSLLRQALAERGEADLRWARK
jgi:processive 1,2-diacylglycerol beta-glucosyltransferase